MTMPKKWFAAIIVLAAVCLSASLLAFAEESADNARLQIQLQIDNPVILINGESMEVEPPYLDNATTLVPLRVITTAFGAQLEWEDATQSIDLSYNGRLIHLQIGNHEVVADGAATELAVAPVIRNATTMVPLRFITEHFGATLDFNPETFEITIVHTLEAAAAGYHGGINEDEGKTRVGDSFYGWSIAYPSGLVQEWQSYDGDFIEFSDAKGEFNLYIIVEEDAPDQLSRDGYLRNLAGEVGGAILDRTFVAGDYPYARITSRWYDGEYQESRLYLHDNKYYYLFFGVPVEDNFKNPSKQALYQELLNSFKPEFDRDEATLKDVSVFKDGFRQYVDSDYGISFNLPARWDYYGDSGQQVFYHPSDSISMTIRVTSIEPGDRLANWVNRQNQLFEEAYLPEYRRIEPSRLALVSNAPARTVVYHYTHGDQWMTNYVYYIFKGDYKYVVNFIFPEDSKAEEIQLLIQSMISSFEIDAELKNSGIGYLYDDRDFIDKSAASTIRSRKYNYSIDIPDYWHPLRNNNDSDEVEYGHIGFTLTMNVMEADFAEFFAAFMQGLLTDGSLAEETLIEESEEEILGVTARVWVIEEVYSGVKSSATMYLIPNGEYVYYFIMDINHSVQTEENVQRLKDVFHSFRFLN